MRSVILLISSLFLLSCISTPERVEVKKTPFQWDTEVSETVNWSIKLPKTQNYVLTIEVTNVSDEVKNMNFITDQGHNLRLTVKPESRKQSFFFEDLLMMMGPIRLTLDSIDEGLVVKSIALGDTFLLNEGELDLEPINPNATKEVKDLMQTFGKVYGSGIISGQMDLTWDDSVNMELRVKRFTRQAPALMGFDFMNYKGSNDGGSGYKQVEEAITFSEKGGLVTFCWHWRVGPDYKFYTKETGFRINQDPESDEYKTIIEDIDQVAIELKKIQDRGVPVLWRPLHEASGGWFWWGATGEEDFLFLWNLMYDRMTNYHGLNNLIWVWNGEDASWYPGDNMVDIIGVDIYDGKGNHESQIGRFREAQSYVEGDKLKLIALTENGSIPDPVKLQEEGVPWVWFMTWNDNNQNAPDDFFSGDQWTSHKNKRVFFENDYFINLEDLSGY